MLQHLTHSPPTAKIFQYVKIPAHNKVGWYLIKIEAVDKAEQENDK